MANPYLSVLRTPGAARFAVAGFVGRMPMSMMTLAVLLVVQHRTGSYALAGLASAATTVMHAAAAPLIGRLVDRRGQSAVIPGMLLVFLGGVALLDVSALLDAPTPFLFVGAVVAGVGQVPYTSLVRSRWAHLLSADDASLSTALALESVADEAIYVTGPVLVTVLAVVDPLLGPLVAAVLALAGTAVFLGAGDTEPPFSRGRRGKPAWRYPGLWVVVGSSLMLGTVFGTLEVSMVAFAQGHGAAGLAGVLLGTIAFGSMLAGLWYGSRVWRRGLAVRYRLSLATLAVGSLPAVVVPSVPWMVPASLLIGLSIAPTLIAGNGLIAQIMPEETRTEGFSWESASINVGAALGSALAGVSVDVLDVRAGFGIGPLAAVLGVLVAAVGARHLVPGRDPSAPAEATGTGVALQVPAP